MCAHRSCNPLSGISHPCHQCPTSQPCPTPVRPATMLLIFSLKLEATQDSDLAIAVAPCSCLACKKNTFPSRGTGRTFNVDEEVSESICRLLCWDHRSAVRWRRLLCPLSRFGQAAGRQACPGWDGGTDHILPGGKPPLRLAFGLSLGFGRGSLPMKCFLFLSGCFLPPRCRTSACLCGGALMRAPLSGIQLGVCM